MTRFAANLTMMFNEVPFLDRFEAASRAGFDAVEFLFPYDFPAEEVRERARQAGVEVVLFNMPPGDWAAGDRGLAALPERADEFRAGIEKALVYARALEVPRLHVMAGIAPPSSPEHGARYVSAIAEAADAAGALGIDVLLEPLNKRDMPGYFLDDFERAAEIIGQLSRSSVKLQFDIYHCQILHGDITRRLEKYRRIIGHIQTASVPLRNEPGTGELDDAHIFRTIDVLGYDGHVGCEYRPKISTTDGLAWLNKVND